MMWGICTFVPTVALLVASLATGGHSDSASLLKIPENASYAAPHTSYDDGGMGPMYDFARSFINTALPGGFPKEFINETWNSMDGKGSGLNINELLPKLLKEFAGYVAALAVGFLFMLIFPLVGCCFCCCRLCGNCGGKRKQTITPKIHWRQRIYTLVLAIISVFMLTGNICTYVSNQRMTVAIDTIEKTVKDNLDDVDSYLNLVETQIVTIGLLNLNITKNHILQNMDQTTLEKNISDYILNEMSGGALRTMEANINTAKNAFDKVTTAVHTTQTAFSSVQSVCTGCHDPTSSQEFKDLDKHSKDFANFSGDSVVNKVKNQLRTKISNQLRGLSTQKGDVQTAFTKIEDKVHKVVEEVKKFKSNADSGIDLEYYKKKVTSVLNDVRTYDKYRYGAGAGLAAMTTLIVILQLLGLTFGTVGHLAKQKPTERGCVSHSGGNFLIASVVFIFLFASLLMLLTTVSFAVGSLLERFICQPLSPPSMELLQVADAHLPTKDTLRAELSSVIRDCKDGKAAYTAFHLSSMFNLTAVDEELHTQEKKIDTQMKNALSGVTNIQNMNFSTTASSSLQQFKDSLKNIQFANITGQIDQAIQKIPNMPQTSTFRQSLNSLKDGLVELKAVKDKVDDWSNDLTTSLQKVTANMTAGNMGKVVESYKNKIINIAEEYVNSTKDNVENKVGRCTPLWNLYNSIMLVSVCQYTVDAFNGFWFSIGWCLFFFIPAVIFAMKLSKFYLRMDNLEDGAQGLDRQESVGLAHLRSNKVAPSDEEN